MDKLESSLAEGIPVYKVSEVRREYYFLLEQLDAFIKHLHQHTTMKADVYVTPVSTKDDIGAKTIQFAFNHITGKEAIFRALDHLCEHTITGMDQTGLMAKRLPGTLHIKTDCEHELRLKITKINQIKDNLSNIIRRYSPSIDEQFQLTKKAIPYAIRKSISRHIHTIEKGIIKSIGFSVSNRSSMSKSEPRQYWLDKIGKTRKNIRNRIDSDDWSTQLDIEERALNSLSETTYLRIERPLRKSPIANILFYDGGKTTISAHSPILIINDTIDIKPLRKYRGSATGTNKKTSLPIIERWHLYIARKVK